VPLQHVRRRLRSPSDREKRKKVPAMDSTIEAKLAAGLLPCHRPVKSWAGFGTGNACDGCDESILATEVEHELDFAESPTLRLHATCEAIWRELVAETQPATPQSAHRTMSLLSAEQWRQRIRVRLAQERLPAIVVGIYKTHRGTGRPCIVCRRATESTEVERELDGVGVVLIAHETCYALWREESVSRSQEKRP